MILCWEVLKEKIIELYEKLNLRFIEKRKKVPPFNTAQKMKFCVKDFFCKCDQIHRKLRIWSRLLKKSLMEYFNFCAVQIQTQVKSYRLLSRENVRNCLGRIQWLVFIWLEGGRCKRFNIKSIKKKWLFCFT